MSKMLKSSGGIGAATMTSRVLGLVREQVYAGFMGTGDVYGAFVLAFTVPNLFRRLLGEGSLTAAFIPVFKAKEKTEGAESMWKAANAVISGLLAVSAVIVMVALAVLGVLLMFGHWDANTQLMLKLMGMMFPYMGLACLGAVFIGILNARGHFFIPALGAAVLNVVMIASVLLLAPRMGPTLNTRIYALAIGVLAAGIAQTFFQYPTMHREGFRYRWVSPWSDPTVREVVKKMIPSTVGVAAFQINVTLTQGLAFGENAKILAQFAYAVRLMELPQGVFGLSLATFLLPTLAGLAVDKNYPVFRTTLRQAVGHLIFINLLASVLLFTLAEPIIRLLFERGQFNSNSTQHVSLALMCLVPGLIAFSLVNILARAFYALNDLVTPMKISVFCLAINLVIAATLLLVFKLGAGALGIANSTSAAVNLSLLAFALRKKLKTLEMKSVLAQLPLLAVAGLLAGLVAWQSSIFWSNHFGHATLVQRLGEVFVPMTAASVVYFALCSFMKISSAREMLGMVTSRVTGEPAAGK